MRLSAVVVGLGKLIDAIQGFLHLYQLVSFLVETLCVLIALILHDRQTHVHLVAGLAALMFGVIMAASDLLNVLVDLENLLAVLDKTLSSKMEATTGCSGLGTTRGADSCGLVAFETRCSDSG